MSDHGASEAAAEHPLFRVLVLMGGSVALSCGGSAIIDGNQAGNGAGGGVAQGGVAQGGGAGAGAGAGAAARGGSGGGGGAAADCPPAQWDCSGLGLTCSYDLSGVGRPKGCVCDPTRPKSVADCRANEDLICLAGYADQPDVQSWDGLRHVQCACVPGPSIPTYDQCPPACQKTYPMLFSAPNGLSCRLPSGMTCDPSGAGCTATAADVLRQDGIVCGCASVILK